MASGFTVQSVTERPSLNAAGNLVNMTVIHLETVMGGTGSLEIPTKQYETLTSTDEGRQVLSDMLEQKANQLDIPLTL